MSFGLLVLKTVYFFLPAYFANMAPVLFKWLPFLNKPVHENKFGTNKTWRGIVVAVIIGTLTFYLQKLIYSGWFKTISLIDYNDFTILLGALMGLGAILGDLVKSYYKRKVGIASGKSWIPFDQLDFVVGGLLFTFFIYVPPALVTLLLFIVSPLLHISANLIGYVLKIKKNKL